MSILIYSYRATLRYKHVYTAMYLYISTYKVRRDGIISIAVGGAGEIIESEW